MNTIRWVLLLLVGVVYIIFAASLYSNAQVQEVYNWPTYVQTVTISVGNTYQTILTPVPIGGVARRSVTIQNNNTSADSCWIYIGSLASATKATSIILDSNHGSAYTRYYPFAPSDQINATCATGGDSLYVDFQ